MAEQILMLALSPTMEKGTITKWNKKVGEPVAEADVLCEVETDKATMEYESQNEGTLLKILVEEGQDAAVGEPIAIVGEEGEEVEDQAEEKSEKSEEKEQAEEAEQGEQESEQEEDREQKGAAIRVEKPDQKEKPKEKEPQKQDVETEQVRSTPLARNLAKEYGLDINQIKGTGPKGRITKEDIESAAQTQGQRLGKTQTPSIKAAPESAAALEDKTIKISSKRSTIAKRLAESKFSAPHYYLTVSLNADAMVMARKKVSSDLNTKISFNAFLIKFAAEAIKKHPQINSSWQEENIVQHGSVDIGLAVAQDDGLITPVVRNCGGKGIIAINNELADLIERARNNQLKAEEYSDNTFTISSLGSYGVEEFTAIINPPASAILAVGAINKIPAFDEKEQLISRQTMKLTLSCDHRVLDGAVSAAFLNTLKQIIESPISALY
jgi:pyruvate dehydrogenase E2 component (dihydrolipoamide acetyltransferase)